MNKQIYCCSAVLRNSLSQKSRSCINHLPLLLHGFSELQLAGALCRLFHRIKRYKVDGCLQGFVQVAVQASKFEQTVNSGTGEIYKQIDIAFCGCLSPGIRAEK